MLTRAADVLSIVADQYFYDTRREMAAIVEQNIQDRRDLAYGVIERLCRSRRVRVVAGLEPAGFSSCFDGQTGQEKILLVERGGLCDFLVVAKPTPPAADPDWWWRPRCGARDDPS
jgi:hypothetical protein